MSTMVSQWEVIPWGNAKMGADGTVTCQHGASECEGNKLQACAQAHNPNISVQMDLFRCMGAAYPASVTDAQACAVAAGMDWASIEACYGGAEGTALIDSNYKRTAALNPPRQGTKNEHAYVPKEQRLTRSKPFPLRASQSSGTCQPS